MDKRNGSKKRSFGRVHSLVGYVSQIALYVAGGLLLVFATFDLPSIS